MSRVFNFSAGPAMLPQSVLEKAQSEMLDWHNTGMSVMEMSHRGKDYMSIAETAMNDLRDIMAIPDTHEILFLQGGASSQFAMVPLNLLPGTAAADYINTGSWSKKAIAEAQRYGQVNLAGAAPEGKMAVPAQQDLQLSADAAYLHYTPNETIQGIEFPYLPDSGGVPLVADFSSTILSRPVEVEKYGIIYAGAQKNIGPAGLTVVIVREDLIGQTLPGTPTMFDYGVLAQAESMYNTPPTYAWYLAGLVFQWLKRNGGLQAMAATNQRKAQALYKAIDDSAFYSNPVDPACRSWMNVPFILANPELDGVFLSEAKDAGLVTLKGHRSVGGMRASIYNAMPEAGVQALISFMSDFESRHG